MNYLMNVRCRIGVSQKAMAAAIQVTQPNISHYECGRQSIPVEVARRIAAYAKTLGHVVTYDDIYGPIA